MFFNFSPAESLIDQFDNNKRDGENTVPGKGFKCGIVLFTSQLYTAFFVISPLLRSHI